MRGGRKRRESRWRARIRPRRTRRRRRRRRGAQNVARCAPESTALSLGPERREKQNEGSTGPTVGLTATRFAVGRSATASSAWRFFSRFCGGREARAVAEEVLSKRRRQDASQGSPCAVGGGHGGYKRARSADSTDVRPQIRSARHRLDVESNITHEPNGRAGDMREHHTTCPRRGASGPVPNKAERPSKAVDSQLLEGKTNGRTSSRRRFAASARTSAFCVSAWSTWSCERIPRARAFRACCMFSFPGQPPAGPRRT